jgi:hypothetical protein
LGGGVDFFVLHSWRKMVRIKYVRSFPKRRTFELRFFYRALSPPLLALPFFGRALGEISLLQSFECGILCMDNNFREDFNFK